MMKPMRAPRVSYQVTPSANGVTGSRLIEAVRECCAGFADREEASRLQNLGRHPFHEEKAYRNGNVRSMIGLDSPYAGGDLGICVENSFVLQTIDPAAKYTKEILVISTDWGLPRDEVLEPLELEEINRRVIRFATELQKQV